MTARRATLVKPCLWDFDAFIRTLPSSYQYGRVRRQKLLWAVYWGLSLSHEQEPFEAAFIRQKYGPVETNLDSNYERTGDANKLDNTLQGEVRALVGPLLETPTKELVEQSHRNPAYCSGELKTPIARSEVRRAKTDHLLCTAEWHLRDKPFAAVLYSYALSFGRRKDGKRYFHLSVRQLADYFGWDKKTLCPAIAVLQQRGFFKLVHLGTGPLASEYEVLTHKEWSQSNPQRCRATIQSNGTQKSRLVSRLANATVPSEGVLLSRQTRTQTPRVSKEKQKASEATTTDGSSQAEKEIIRKVWTVYVTELDKGDEELTDARKAMGLRILRHLKASGSEDPEHPPMERMVTAICMVRDLAAKDKRKQYLTEWHAMFSNPKTFDSPVCAVGRDRSPKGRVCAEPRGKGARSGIPGPHGMQSNFLNSI